MDCEPLGIPNYDLVEPPNLIFRTFQNNLKISTITFQPQRQERMVLPFKVVQNNPQRKKFQRSIKNKCLKE